MIKKFLFTLEINVNIPDKITPELIEEIIADGNYNQKIPNYQVRPEKHQAFIDYFKNNESLHEQCIAGDLFFKFTENSTKEQLAKHLTFKIFDEIAVEAGPKMGPAYATFINSLFNLEAADKNDKDTPRMYNKVDIEEEEKLEIDRSILLHCLMNYKITAVSVEVVKNILPGSEEEKDVFI